MIFHFMHPLLGSQLVPFVLLLLVKTAAVLLQGDLSGPCWRPILGHPRPPAASISHFRLFLVSCIFLSVYPSPPMHQSCSLSHPLITHLVILRWIRHGSWIIMIHFITFPKNTSANPTALEYTRRMSRRACACISESIYTSNGMVAYMPRILMNSLLTDKHREKITLRNY